MDLAQEMQTEPSKTARLGFITGLVPKLKVTSFERILFRATRGNMFLKQAPIEQPVDDPATGEKVLYFPLSVYEEMEIICNIILLRTGVFTLFLGLVVLSQSFLYSVMCLGFHLVWSFCSGICLFAE